MIAKSALRIDLNNLFQPAISDGLKSLEAHADLFLSAFRGIKALKDTGHLTFALLPEDSVLLNEVTAAAANYSHVQNVVVLGIGGSALGLLSCYQALKGRFADLLAPAQKLPRLFVMDHIDPQSFGDLYGIIREQKNLFVLISKSGETSETLAQYLWVKRHFPAAQAQDFFIITDPQKGYLRRLAHERGIPTLPVPIGVGGRFSLFSPVGLFPLAVCGIDVSQLLEGAGHMERACQSDRIEQNPAGALAVTLHAWLQRDGFSQVVFMPYSDRLHYLPDWFAQLWGESLGKRHTLDNREICTGTTPIKSVGVTDQHSLLQLYLDGPRDKVILFIEVDAFWEPALLAEPPYPDDRIDFLSQKSLAELLRCEKLATEEALRESGRPNATIRIAEINAFQLGQIYQLLMNVIPYLGVFGNINPFDQPAVERIKRYVYGFMGKKGFETFRLESVLQKKSKDLIL